jgi:hypothetical protein
MYNFTHSLLSKRFLHGQFALAIEDFDQPCLTTRHGRKLFLNKLEIIVSDWGSEIPLPEVLNLVPEAKDRVKFVHVPPDIAKVEQKDSKFPEVFSMQQQEELQVIILAE